MTPISSALNQLSAPSVQHTHDDASHFSSTQEDYNYNTLEPKARVFVRQRTTEIKALMRRTSEDIIDIGQKLAEVKEQLLHGNFRDWLKAEFSWSLSTALRFMHVSEQFKSVTMTHLDIAPTALYLIAAPSTSPEVRQEALKRASEGEAITSAKVKLIIDKYKSAKPKKTQTAATTDDSSPVMYQPSPSPTAVTQPVIAPSKPSQVVQEEDEDDSEEVDQQSSQLSQFAHEQDDDDFDEADQDYSANYGDAMRSPPSMDWQEGDFCQWGGKAGQIIEIQGDEAIVDFFPPENVRTVRLADLHLPDLDQTPDSTDASKAEDAALNTAEDNVTDEERSEIQVMSSITILEESMNTINNGQVDLLEVEVPIADYPNGSKVKATPNELTIDVDAIAVEPKADDNRLEIVKYSALSQAYANLVSLLSEYSDKPLEHMTFREADELLKQIIYDLNFSSITGADYFSDDQIAEIWRAIASRVPAAHLVQALAPNQLAEVLQEIAHRLPESLRLHNWSNAELEYFVNTAVKELNSRHLQNLTT